MSDTEISNDLLNNDSSKINWDSNIENMLVKWCDQAKCYEWMFVESHQIYKIKAQRLMILITVLGSISGLSNVIAGDITVGHSFHMSWIFGSISIFVGMLSILQDKFAYDTQATEFRQYSVEWSNIRRSIEEELWLPPDARGNCSTFLKFIRKAISQVYTNGSAKIPTSVKDKCYKKFNSIPNFDIPDICGQIEHTTVYSNSQLITIITNSD